MNEQDIINNIGKIIELVDKTGLTQNVNVKIIGKEIIQNESNENIETENFIIEIKKPFNFNGYLDVNSNLVNGRIPFVVSSLFFDSQRFLCNIIDD